MEPTKEEALTLKKRIHAGETLFGVAVPISVERSRLEGVLEEGGYDFVVVDSQHAAFNEERLIEFCEMAAEIGVHVQFRIKHTRHTYLVGNYLDLGPTGIEVPQVEEECTVDEAVANFYYPQDGVRSWGGRNRLGSSNRSDHREYRKWWKETGVLWMQIESIDAVSNARQLAKPGVDCLSFGPMDLTLSLEAHPLHPFKTLDDCLGHVVTLLEGTDTKACYRNNTPDTRQKYLDMGVTVLLEVGQHYGL